MGFYLTGRVSGEDECEVAAAAGRMNFLSKLIPSKIRFCQINPLGAEVDW